MIYISIVVPSYNSKRTIAQLLKSLSKSQKVDFETLEIVIVDDCSTDGTVESVKKFIEGPKNKFTRFRLIKLKENGGPAAARNIGVKYTRGKVILFLDADVLVYKNTLFEILKSFKDDPDLYALTGVWDKKQFSRKFFPRFKALRDWSYWINERDPKNYYYLFSTRVAAIDKKLFQRLGGFDTEYKAALIEDIELTYRIARRYAVVFNPKVIVHHEFEDFWPVAKKYFFRSYFWSRIYRLRKKFDPVATTSKEALTTISAGALVILGFVILTNSFFVLFGKGHILLTLFWIFLLIHLWGVRKFLVFCLKKEGPFFMLKALFTGIALYLVILSGAAFSIFEFKEKDE